MASNEHSYCLPLNNLSEYAKSLDSVSLRRYIEKLRIQPQPDKCVSVTDPYLIKECDWIVDVKLWPHITYPDIYNYLVNSSNKEFSSKNLKNYKSLSAYEYVLSGKVQTVKIHKPTSNVAVLCAEVQPSQRLREDNHVPWVIAENSGIVMAAHCTCMAGIGEVCSHVAALLFKVELAVRLDYVSGRAPTEDVCKWNSTFPNKKVHNVPVSNMDLHKVCWSSAEQRTQRKRNYVQPLALPKLTQQEMKNLEKINKESLIIQNLTKKRCITQSPVQSLLPPLLSDIISSYNGQDLFSDIKKNFTTNNCKLLAEQSTEQSACKIWREHRRGRFTASLFKEIIKRKSWNDSYLIKFISPPQFSTAALRWGVENEVKALNIYRKKMEEKHKDVIISRSGLIINPDMPYLGATPDAVVHCSCCGRGVVEVKCPYKHRDNLISAAANTDKSFCLDATGLLKKSHDYFYQIQGQIAIASVEYCDFVVWTEKEFVTQRLERDGDFWEEIHADLKETYFTKLVPFIKNLKL